MTPKTYQDNFFNHHLKMSISSAEQVIPLVLKYVKPSSVIDIGCGIGTWLSIWEKLGITDFLGVDGDYVALENLLIPREKFVVANLEEGYRSFKKFDFATCLEVAEHITPQGAANLINSLCEMSDVILFSAAIPGQEGTLHVNEQYPTYWLEFFRKNDYVPVDCLRKKIWSNEKVSFWYRQNLLFYVKSSILHNYEKLKIEAEKTDIDFLNIVHPGYFDYKTNKALKYEKLLGSKKAMLMRIIRNTFKKSVE